MQKNQIVALLCLAGAFLLYSSDNPDGGILPNVHHSPVPGSGLHVLIVEDRGARQKLPPTVFDAMMSSDVDEAIRKVGGHKYLYDQNQDVSTKDDPWVKDAMKVKRDSLPWLILDYNGNGTAEDFRKYDPKSFKELLDKYISK